MWLLTHAMIKMEGRKSGAQTRCHFSHLTLIFQLEIYVQESSCLEWIHAISNFTGSVLYCCWAACEIWRKMRERTCYDALTYIASKQRIRERTLRCANERFLVPTMNIDYLLHSVTIYKSLQYRNMFQSMHCIRLTLKRLGHFSFQYVILFPNVVHQKSNIFIWNWSNKWNV